ncbi:hypothetical protein LDJ90_02550 [Fusobacterium vincentii]|uniref:hypothetical protein n=1 Tax=Fusobacterium vincentii TaxID=155615 RepID=UPI000C1B991C|nr:hypothetical protein [Fusobacterium vincentii]ATV06047.1 hypothetical protein CS401_04215 [Fusobacterium vincentii]
MEKEKVLEIEFKEVWDNKWAWKIIKNEVDFKNTGGEIPFNNIKITCANKEDLYVFDNWLVEWGLIDDYSLIDSNLKTDIQDFINYINEKYGTPKRWRADKEKEYFFVTGTNEITIDEEYYNEADNTRYELGNYFKTEEEAEKVKEELDKFWAKVREIGGDE